MNEGDNMTTNYQTAPENKNSELIGFHKGSLATLAKEKEEFEKTLSIVNQLMMYHLNELKKLGIDLTKQMNNPAIKQAEKSKDKLDELIKTPATR